MADVSLFSVGFSPDSFSLLFVSTLDNSVFFLSPISPVPYSFCIQPKRGKKTKNTRIMPELGRLWGTERKERRLWKHGLPPPHGPPLVVRSEGTALWRKIAQTGVFIPILGMHNTQGCLLKALPLPPLPLPLLSQLTAQILFRFHRSDVDLFRVDHGVSADPCVRHGDAVQLLLACPFERCGGVVVVPDDCVGAGVVGGSGGALLLAGQQPA